MTSSQIELCIARHVSYRQNIVVPNVSWSLFPRQEVDLLVIRPSGYAIEYEIKTSAADVKADLNKHHSHWNKLIRQTWFCVPSYLECNPNIPEYAGILSVYEKGKHRFAKTIRAARINPDAQKLSEEQIKKVLHCGCMRMWSIKEHLIQIREGNWK